MLRALAVAIALLFGSCAALPVYAQGAAGVGFFGSGLADPTAPPSGGGGELGTLFDNYALNIHSTYDPLCDPATAAANGIIWCEGFEDGKITVAGDTLGALTDGWEVAKIASPENSCGTGACSDPEGTAFTECNASPSDYGRADYGLGGTPCTGTHGWDRDIVMSHCLRAYGGNPIACVSNHTAGQTDVPHVRIRFLFRFAGASSTRCDAGFPNCPVFNFYPSREWAGTCSGGDGSANGLTCGWEAQCQAIAGGGAVCNGNNSNGVKGLEFSDGLDMAGLENLNWSTRNEPSGSFLLGGFDAADSPDGSNVGKPCMVDENYCYQHLNGASLSFYDPARADHVFAVEIELKQVNADDASIVRVWYDDCGLDGKSCPATPTLKIESTSLDFRTDIGHPFFSHSDSVWFNWWTDAGGDGEIQIDEIVAADGSIRTTPIGWPPYAVAP